MSTSDKVCEKFDHDLIDLLELRYVVWNRYVIAKCIRETAESEQRELGHKNRNWCSKEFNAAANKNFDHIMSEMKRIMSSCVEACSVINALIFETLSKKMDYSGRLNLNSLWKAGTSLDNRLGAVGIASNEHEKLSDYSNRFEIEIDGLLSMTTNGSPVERVIDGIKSHYGDASADTFSSFVGNLNGIENSLLEEDNYNSANENGGEHDD